MRPALVRWKGLRMGSACPRGPGQGRAACWSRSPCPHRAQLIRIPRARSVTYRASRLPAARPRLRVADPRLPPRVRCWPSFPISVLGTGVQDQGDEEVPSRAPQPGRCILLEFAVLEGGAHETGREIRLPDAMRETQALVVRLHQVEPGSPRNGQPDIKVTTRKFFLQEAMDLVVDALVFRQQARFRLIGWLTLVVILVLDVDGISKQSDAGQRGKPLDSGFTGPSKLTGTLSLHR